MAVGIEKISIYSGSMYLPMHELVAARGQSRKDICEDMMIVERSVLPPWEDVVTMAVNAANDMLTAEDRASIGLLLVATESSLDQEKSLSTWVQRYLNLPDDCRNAEIKLACYAGTISLVMALSALSTLPAGRKVLVITTDLSRAHFGKPYEFVMGCGAVAFLVSDKPRFLALHNDTHAVYTYEVSDVTRPTSRVEAGHSETSLLSYIEGITTTFERFIDQKNVDGNLGTFAAFRAHYPYQIYHAPFSGITYRAHKAVHRHYGRIDHELLKSDYECSVLPSLQYNRRMGSTYAGSIFISMLGLVDAIGDAIKGKQVGIYSYGSGSCAEYFGATYGAEAVSIANAVNFKEKLDGRKQLSVADYEALEMVRDSFIDQGDYQVDTGGYDNWYESFYAGKQLLVYRGISQFVREYAWS